jgi:valyl-tRNA synthetase
VEKIDENYKHVVRTCYKCGTVIEPQIKSQWFVKMKPLAEKAIEVIEKEKIKYIPEHFKKISLHWLHNIQDWNISRQIVWGIPIPGKICADCGHGMSDLEDIITKCEKCGGKVTRDQDTFDTWFSSSQWPFISLGYPEGKDFKTFYPTSVLETGGDIIFFWVARMIMLGFYMTGEIPFRTVYIHGMVLDAKGQKMSKSKGNVINPLALTEKYGTDAFRISLVVGNTPGTFLALAEERVRGYKNFANKLWNITRFVLENSGEENVKKEENNLTREFDELVKDTTSDMENFRFYLAAEKIYHYIWHRFADEIIEESTKDAGIKRGLLPIWEECLKILHPFMPFVTEEIWQTMGKKNLLMVEKWPLNIIQDKPHVDK